MNFTVALDPVNYLTPVNLLYRMCIKEYGVLKVFNHLNLTDINKPHIKYDFYFNLWGLCWTVTTDSHLANARTQNSFCEESPSLLVSLSSRTIKKSIYVYTYNWNWVSHSLKCWPWNNTAHLILGDIITNQNSDILLCTPGIYYLQLISVLKRQLK